MPTKSYSPHENMLLQAAAGMEFKVPEGYKVVDEIHDEVIFAPRTEEEPCYFATCNYTWADLSVDAASLNAGVCFDDREEANRWVAQHYGCLDSPLAETRLNRTSSAVCPRCGNPGIEIAMWVQQDTMQVWDDYGIWDDPKYTFCGDCDEQGHGGHQGAVERYIYR